jgi:hypothetical protein
VQLEFRIRQYVADMNNLAFEDRSPIDRSAISPDSNRSHVFVVVGVEAMCGQILEAVLLQQREIGLVCTAKPRGRLDKCVEHRLQIEGRPADDFQHVRSSGLLLERFGKIGGALA